MKSRAIAVAAVLMSVLVASPLLGQGRRGGGGGGGGGGFRGGGGGAMRGGGGMSLSRGGGGMSLGRSGGSNIRSGSLGGGSIRSGGLSGSRLSGGGLSSGGVRMPSAGISPRSSPGIGSSRGTSGGFNLGQGLSRSSGINPSSRSPGINLSRPGGNVTLRPNVAPIRGSAIGYRMDCQGPIAARVWAKRRPGRGWATHSARSGIAARLAAHRERTWATFFPAPAARAAALRICQRLGRGHPPTTWAGFCHSPAVSLAQTAMGWPEATLSKATLPPI